ncbi:MAG: hypothetical protein WD042_04475 [Phycisphaeraceae bacterium]
MTKAKARKQLISRDEWPSSPRLGYECVAEWEGQAPRWPRYPFRALNEQVRELADRLWEDERHSYDEYENAVQAARTAMMVIPSKAAVELVRRRLSDPTWEPLFADRPERWLSVAELLIRRYGVAPNDLPRFEITRVIATLALD